MNSKEMIVKYQQQRHSTLIKVFNFVDIEDNQILAPKFIMDKVSLGWGDEESNINVHEFYTTYSKQLSQDIFQIFSIIGKRKIEVKTLSFYEESRWTINDFTKVSKLKDSVIIRGEINTLKLPMYQFVNSYYDPETRDQQIRDRIIAVTSIAAGVSILLLLLIIFLRRNKKKMEKDMNSGVYYSDDSLNPGLSKQIINQFRKESGLDDDSFEESMNDGLGNQNYEQIKK